MSKTIERVIDAIWEAHGQIDRDECIPLAEYAIQALGIIILPVDAKPQDGDLVRSREGTIFIFMAGTPHRYTDEIIQRDGKPVKHERE